MGWSLNKVGRFEFLGVRTSVFSDGNNVARVCYCGDPVIFVYQSGR